jgi:hypothetical protein
MREPLDDGFLIASTFEGRKVDLHSCRFPGESVIWSDKPQAICLAKRSIPKALMGVGLTVFMILWMSIAARGGHNKWDRGRKVTIFATHNVLIAAAAGVCMFPLCLCLVTWPLHTWWKGKRTRYVLTDRRAIVEEAGLLGGIAGHSFPADALTLMRCDPQKDGKGDLVFEDRKNWIGMSQPVGFLAVERVREVEALVRNTLFSEEPRHRPLERPLDVPIFEARTYLISAVFRLYQALAIAVGVVSAVCLVGNLAIGLVVVLIAPRMGLAALTSFAAESGWPGLLGITGGIAIGVVSLAIMGFVTWGILRFALDTPTEITVSREGAVELRSWVRIRTLRADEITSITTGGWADPNGFRAVILHEGGKVVLINLFRDFRNLLDTIKALNPGLKVSGF